MAFSFRNFVQSTIMRMITGGETDYQVMRYAAGWYDKDVLTDADMTEIEAAITARDPEPATEPEPETQTEEPTETV